MLPGVLPVGITSVTYRPALDFNGVDTFSYSSSDCLPFRVAVAQEVSLHVTPVQDLPVAAAMKEFYVGEGGLQIVMEQYNTDADNEPIYFWFTDLSSCCEASHSRLVYTIYQHAVRWLYIDNSA